MLSMLVCLALAQAPAKPATPPKPATPVKARRPVVMVPDPTWEPFAGAQGDVVVEGALVAESSNHIEDLLQFELANDQTGITKALERGNATRLKRGTKVLVIEIRRQDDDTVEERYLRKLDVRILDGPLKDQRRWVADRAIGRLIPAAAPRPLSRAAARKAWRRAATNQALDAITSDR